MFLRSTRRKKGDLNLSINAIVVLILAITMLGLGLAFMKNMFSKTTGQFDEVSQTMKDQIIGDLKGSNDRLAFNQNEVIVKKGDKKEVFFGIRNDLGTDSQFRISVGCTDAISSGAPIQLYNAVANGAQTARQVQFNTLSQTAVKNNEIEVLKMEVNIPSTATQTTYTCEMYLCPIGGASQCLEVPGVQNPATITATPAPTCSDGTTPLTGGRLGEWPRQSGLGLLGDLPTATPPITAANCALPTGVYGDAKFFVKVE